MSAGEDEWANYDSGPIIAAQELEDEVESLRDENHRLEAAIEDALQARDKWHSVAHQQKLENERLHALIEEFAAFAEGSGWRNLAAALRARAARPEDVAR